MTINVDCSRLIVKVVSHSVICKVMLVADRSALAATVQQGLLAIREREMNLFAGNLNAIGTQAALFAGFAFTALAGMDLSQTSEAFRVFLALSASLTFGSSLHCVCRATFVNMWGPSLALQGASAEDVIFAVDKMRTERAYLYRWGVISMCCFIIMASLVNWVTLGDVSASFATVVIILMACHTVMVERAVRKTFEIQNNALDLGLELPSTPQSRPPPSTPSRPPPSIPSRPPPSRSLRVTGYLWKRSDVGSYIRYFAVLDEHGLDLYGKRKDYNMHRNPVTRNPIPLQEYVIDATHRVPSAYGFLSRFRSVDPQLCIVLVPRVVSETQILEPLEFRFANLDDKRQWSQVLSAATSGAPLDVTDEVQSTTSGGGDLV